MIVALRKVLAHGVDQVAIAALRKAGGPTHQTDVMVLLEVVVGMNAF